MQIIGITGTLGAGKGTIVEYLIQKGFRHFSVRSFIADEISRRGMQLNRDTLTLVANDLRKSHSSSYIVDRLYDQALGYGVDSIIESIRTPGEIESLRQKGSFILFAVDADPETRYERIRRRKSATDHISFSEFRQNELREMTSEDPDKQNLSACIRMADYVFLNNGTTEELFREVQDVLDKNF